MGGVSDPWSLPTPMIYALFMVMGADTMPTFAKYPLAVTPGFTNFESIQGTLLQ